MLLLFYYYIIILLFYLFYYYYIIILLFYLFYYYIIILLFYLFYYYIIILFILLLYYYFIYFIIYFILFTDSRSYSLNAYDIQALQGREISAIEFSIQVSDTDIFYNFMLLFYYYIIILLLFYWFYFIIIIYFVLFTDSRSYSLNPYDIQALQGREISAIEFSIQLSDTDTITKYYVNSGLSHGWVVFKTYNEMTFKCHLVGNNESRGRLIVKVEESQWIPEGYNVSYI